VASFVCYSQGTVRHLLLQQGIWWLDFIKGMLTPRGSSPLQKLQPSAPCTFLDMIPNLGGKANKTLASTTNHQLANSHLVTVADINSRSSFVGPTCSAGLRVQVDGVIIKTSLNNIGRYCK